MSQINNLREKIATSDLAENVKVFLLLNLDKFNEEQIDWLIKNL